MAKNSNQKSDRRAVEEKTEAFLLPILERMGFELWDVEYVKEGKDHFLRAFIDKEGGITIDDCVEVSREMNEILDREDYVKEEYIFEVSSPGLGRTLKRPRDFEKSLGRIVDLHTYKAVEGTDRRKDFCGKLLGASDGVIRILEDGQELSFEKDAVSKVCLHVDF